MKAFEWNGLWWLPDAPESKCFGTLRSNDAGELRLALTGSLADQDLAAFGGDLPTIHGEVTGVRGGPRVTLRNCFVTRQTFGSGIHAQQEVFAHRAYLGEYLAESTDSHFKSAQIALSGLGPWAHNLTGFERPRSEPFSFIWHHPEPISGDLDRCTFNLGVGCSSSGKIREQRLTESVGLILTFGDVVPESVIQNDYVYSLQNFFTFATDHPNALTELKLRRGDASVDQITVFGPLTYTDENAANDLTPWQMLFALPDVVDRLDTVLSRWIEFSRQMAEVCTVYFASQYRPPGYLDLRFQLIAQALSLYCARRGRTNPTATRTDNLLMKAAPNLPSEHGEPLRRLFESHPLVMAERAFAALTAEYQGLFEPLVRSPDGSGLARFVEVSLATLDHVLVRGAAADPNVMTGGSELYWLTERAAFLLKMCFLTEIGFTLDEQRAILARNQRYSHLRDTVQPRQASNRTPSVRKGGE